MFENIVTHRIFQGGDLPPFDAIAYQYLIAGNGVFIRTETRFFDALIPLSTPIIRGLAPLKFQFRLKVPRLPARLLTAILTDARRARRADGGLNEVLYQFHHQNQTIQVKKPPQRATAVSVTAASGGNEENILCDLHSHGNMRAFWSGTDDIDEQNARIYCVIGKLDTAPEIRLRVGVYGYWRSLPVTAVFDGNGGFIDLHNKPKKEKSS